jgi:hypothetical protein
MPNSYTKGPGPWCGTPGGYTNHACRCTRCRAANAAAFQKYAAAHPEQREKRRQAQARRRKEKRCQTSS